MENQTLTTGFLALTRLYLKLTEPSEKMITSDEVELFIGSVDKSKLDLLISNNAKKAD
ncbi:MAG: hypothetical protein ACI9SC_001986 [Gammaproteobacteria bacterium]|jgi:hypothetical protein